MNRPPLEVADLVRAAGRAFIERSRRWITWQHLTVLRALARCRTAALGGHLDECIDCGYRPAISYNSCRNRHCPKCQANARHRWLTARRQELLPTRYVHVVFTLPHELAPLALQNKKLLYHLLLQTSAETLLEVARDPKHLGAEIGFFSVLHTWNQKLEHHPHVHCVVPAGGLSLDHSHWAPSHSRFFLPIPVLRRVFRGKFIAALKRSFRQGKLGFHGTLKPLAHPKAFAAWLRPPFRKRWVVYSKPPFGGPEYVLQYRSARGGGCRRRVPASQELQHVVGALSGQLGEHALFLSGFGRSPAGPTSTSPTPLASGHRPSGRRRSSGGTR